ncbi:LytR family transcriptional regulator [Bacillus smithii]|uniref:polyisoprenyl-teichoic acid--peptidoglycan teichoic acid transferase TagU n=1 Tax=Bacillus smithii TaxID=1479 RepID=UPI002E20CD6B|nr:LytR family transcriptional regulator [Bacillus smithii]MED1489196.1 LytR family transcriptional regulator [Bacillus smithii]
MRSDRHKHKKKKRRGLKILLTVLAILLASAGVYAYSIYHSVNKAVESMHAPVAHDQANKRTHPVSLDNKDPFSVLLLGVDERQNDTGRSDTMILAAVNPKKQSVQLLSIPRDTRTEIVGKGTEDKINHAYAFGGVPMSIATVEKFLDIPIDYYIKVNMEGFKDIVDAVDGVTVQNDLDFTYEGEHFPKGTLHLNGEQALKYSRMRYDDPRGDFGRQLRQRQILEGILAKGIDFSSLWKYGDILNALQKNVKTNLTMDDMMKIQKNYKAARNHIQQNEIKGEGTKINGVYYYIVSDSEKQRLSQIFKDQLSLN